MPPNSPRKTPLNNSRVQLPVGKQALLDFSTGQFIMCAMKRTLFLIFGYCLCIAAAFGALVGISRPENMFAYGIVSAYAGCLGYLWIKKARNIKLIENAPTKELPVPETQPLPKP